MLQDTSQFLEDIKNQLRTQKDPQSKVSKDLYNHLNEVFNRIIKYHPYDAFDKFEEISQLVKQTTFKIEDPKYDFEVNGNVLRQNNNLTNAQALEFIERAKRLLAEKNDVAKQDKGLVSRNQKINLPNFLQHAQLLEWAGVSFGEDYNYIIQKSLKRLAALSGAQTLRFFGKIYGSKADYWVAQGTLDYQEEAPTNVSQEKRGDGANAHVYWVTNDLLKDWVQLPESNPDNLQIAKNIKTVLTGNLNAKVNSCPPFQGKERHLLREQLARISHSTEICPVELYTLEEPEGEEGEEEKPIVKINDEFPWAEKNTAALRELEAWTHKNPNILSIGRCKYLPEPEDVDEENEEYKNL